MRKSQKKHNRNNQGFTLVETVVVMFISGVIMYVGAEIVKNALHSAKIEKTIEHQKLVRDVLNEYAGYNGGYPCPANPRLPPSDANYGRAQCRSVQNFINNRDNCTGTPAGIICPNPADSGARDFDNDGQADIVMIGAFPFRTIQDWINSDNQDRYKSRFTELAKKDGYNMLFSYVVTESLTTANPANSMATPYNPYGGVIHVQDENGVSLTDPAGYAQYVLISFGENAKGAYTVDGNAVDACNVAIIPGEEDNGAGAGAGGMLDIELENCRLDDAVYVKAPMSFTSGSNYYDDIIYYQVAGQLPKWSNSLLGNDNESVIYNTNEGRVGINTDNPDERLDVRGDVRAQELVKSPEYCEGDACLDPEDIAGEGSSCPSGQIAYGISEGKLVCDDVNWTLPQKSCANINGKQSFVRGISNKGNLFCCTNEENPDCEEQ